MKVKDLSNRLDWYGDRLALMDSRLDMIVARLDAHDTNHHGKKSTLTAAMTSGTGAILLMGILQGLLAVFGVSLGLP